MHAKKAGLFIVGAPKCGTTSLCDYLDQHPDIYISHIKEPCFFATDFPGIRTVKSLGAYQHLFDKQKEGVCGEGSTWYLYSKNAAKEICNYNSHAKIIVMLRNPIDVIHSLHNQMCYDGVNEDIVDFEEAIRAEPERKAGLRIPPACRIREALYYKDVVRFSEQLGRYFDVFGRDNVHVIIFEDFRDDTASVYREVLRFLRVDEEFTPIINVVNKNKYIRSKWFKRLIHNPPGILDALKKNAKLHEFLRSVRRRLIRVNTQYRTRPPMSDEMRLSLQNEFREDVDKLGVLISRDLGHWVG